MYSDTAIKPLRVSVTTKYGRTHKINVMPFDKIKDTQAREAFRIWMRDQTLPYVCIDGEEIECAFYHDYVTWHFKYIKGEVAPITD